MKIENNQIVYPCGCKFNILDHGPPMRIELDLDYENLTYDCKDTWNFIGTGNTKGLFQLETRFGQQMSKRMKPENLEHLSALAAILRPGCLNSKIEGKSITEHYIDRKNKVDEVKHFHPALEPILSDTLGLLIYQESVVHIANQIAGFSLSEGMTLMKGVSKKKADVISKMKQQFLDGCKNTNIVSEKEAEEIFGWIAAGSRYAFNHSHSLAYAANGYMSARNKAHFKRSFLTSYLYYAKEKPKKFDEIKLLVNNARAMEVDIKCPNLHLKNKHFYRNGKDIVFGLMDVKDFGESAYKQVIKEIEEQEAKFGKPITSFTWAEFLIAFTQNIKTPAVRGMIESGCLDLFQIDRQRMLYEFEQCCELSPKELKYVTENVKESLTTTLKEALGNEKFCMKNRRGKLENILDSLSKPPYSLKDTPDWIAKVEEARMGVALTCSVVDGCKEADQANATCLEVCKKQCRQSSIFLAVELKEVRSIVTKKGKNPGQYMAFVKVADHSGELDTVVFPDIWAKITKTSLCVEGNLVLISGKVGKGGGFEIENMWQMA